MCNECSYTICQCGLGVDDRAHAVWFDVCTYGGHTFQSLDHYTMRASNMGFGYADMRDGVQTRLRADNIHHVAAFVAAYYGPALNAHEATRLYAKACLRIVDPLTCISVVDCLRLCQQFNVLESF